MGRSSAESVAYFMLSLIPAKFSVAVLFVVACFVSTAMGTSVGTITLIAPIAAAVSDASGFDLALCIGSVMGGAMFGDNLSFISDTTIAACNGQGCPMKDKFRENFWIAFPAALVTLGLILVLSLRTDLGGTVNHEYHLIQMVPYILVLDWRYYRDQCISRTFDRYFLWNCNYACDRTDKFCGFDQQHGIWNFRNV